MRSVAITMLLKLWVFGALAFLGEQASAQVIPITWETLTDVSFVDKYSEEYEALYYYPTFGPSVKALQGKEVQITGYMLIFDTDKKVYVLSQNPFSACFFCGKGGPETIVELHMKPGDYNFHMDDWVTVKGRLKLNVEDFFQCNYVLEKVEVVEISEK